MSLDAELQELERQLEVEDARRKELEHALKQKQLAQRREALKNEVRRHFTPKQKEKMHEEFKSVDVTSSGTIDASGVRLLAKRLECKADETRVTELMQSLTMKDGGATFEDFVAWWGSHGDLGGFGEGEVDTQITKLAFEKARESAVRKMREAVRDSDSGHAQANVSVRVGGIEWQPSVEIHGSTIPLSLEERTEMFKRELQRVVQLGIAPDELRMDDPTINGLIKMSFRTRPDVDVAGLCRQFNSFVGEVFPGHPAFYKPIVFDSDTVDAVGDPIKVANVYIFIRSLKHAHLDRLLVFTDSESDSEGDEENEEGFEEALRGVSNIVQSGAFSFKSETDPATWLEGETYLHDLFRRFVFTSTARVSRNVTGVITNLLEKTSEAHTPVALMLLLGMQKEFNMKLHFSSLANVPTKIARILAAKFRTSLANAVTTGELELSEEERVNLQESLGGTQIEEVFDRTVHSMFGVTGKFATTFITTGLKKGLRELDPRQRREARNWMSMVESPMRIHATLGLLSTSVDFKGFDFLPKLYPTLEQRDGEEEEEESECSDSESMPSLGLDAIKEAYEDLVSQHNLRPYTPPHRLLVVGGLSGSGKDALLYRLRTGTSLAPGKATNHLAVTTVGYNRRAYPVWLLPPDVRIGDDDVAVEKGMRGLVETTRTGTITLIWVVDATTGPSDEDARRIHEIRGGFRDASTDRRFHMVVAINKNDLNEVSDAQAQEWLGRLVDQKVREYDQVVVCSAMNHTADRVIEAVANLERKFCVDMNSGLDTETSGLLSRMLENDDDEVGDDDDEDTSISHSEDW